MSAPQQKYRLVALDLDGTTLNKAHRITDRTLAILRKLSARGVVVAIATGRSSESVFGYAKLLQLEQTMLPMVVFNGSVCLQFDTKTGESRELFSNPIPPEASRLLIALAEREGCVIQLYNGQTGEVFAKPTTDQHIELLERYEHLVEKRQTYVASLESEVFNVTDRFAKALVLTFDPDAFMAAATSSLPAGMLHMIRGSPDPFFVEFLRPESNKGTALAALCRELGIGLDQAVAMGDGENDIEMLQTAGLGVAMLNARPTVKAAAKHVTEFSHDEDGVAQFLEQLLELGHFAE